MSTVNTELQTIVETFELLGDWEQRYHYLVELGEQLPPFNPEAKTKANQVVECMSTVHVYAERDAAHPDSIYFHGDCDTAIIKGVLALLIQLFSGHSITDIEALDIDTLFSQLQLAEHLSPNRHVGIFAIVRKMKSQARHCTLANSDHDCSGINP
jgi:cysteine desulfuration protein SufE